MGPFVSSSGMNYIRVVVEHVSKCVEHELQLTSLLVASHYESWTLI